METNDKGRQVAASPETQGKDTTFSTTAKVFELLKSGKEFTAWELNHIVFFNDSRQRIAMLRKAGYPIVDRLLPDRRKLYRLPSNWEQIMNDAKLNKPKDLFYDAD